MKHYLSADELKDCYPEDSLPYLPILTLSISVFLSFIYALITLSFLYHYLRTHSRLRVVFTALEQRDELAAIEQQMQFANYLQEQLLNHLDQDRGDPSMVPLNSPELRRIKLEKAPSAKPGKPLLDKSNNTTAPTESSTDVCSICCDEVQPKALVRRMPECRHMFHQKCIDSWLKMKPTCPNCNRKTREVMQFN
ncbi:hypothetical protein FGO68_gene12078 [Halteria grandinella]|uniref:RING-type domain-containing protein n=1 Tax=Halteria grandinella TaxID=5974 RepID=A0A8J8NBK9_HALGN|nr:hypothetical protein FGO68_gene12078 [Halteria grandinella]